MTKINEDAVSSTITWLSRAIRGRDLSRPMRTPVALLRVSAAINSHVIDGATSGATRGRILGVCRSVELEIWIVNGAEFRTGTGRLIYFFFPVSLSLFFFLSFFDGNCS